MCVVRQRGQCTRMMGMKGRRHNLCWPGKGDGIGVVRVMVKELCEKVVQVRRVSDSVDCRSFLRGCAEVDLWECSA